LTNPGIVVLGGDPAGCVAAFCLAAFGRRVAMVTSPRHWSGLIAAGPDRSPLEV
jgi:pyruvate/2-oxoglutarate dehydrogenase complex dihydrolipoamide dehydrogenase (E3) component|tara:strand:- start:491 stop:652 length:162 start_codon:yes stop_codon:yes gene_type:complete